MHALQYFPRRPSKTFTPVYVALLVLAALAGCGKWYPSPVSAGTIALVCQPGREVYCESGDPRCPDVAASVQDINEVVPGLLVYKGDVPHARIVELFQDKAHGYILVLPADAESSEKGMAAGVIAFTSLDPNWDTSCLPTTPIVLVFTYQNPHFPPSDWHEVVLHEMMHALGCDHAAQNSPYGTVMRPQPLKERRTGLGKADKVWLKTVYGGWN